MPILATPIVCASAALPRAALRLMLPALFGAALLLAFPSDKARSQTVTHAIREPLALHRKAVAEHKHATDTMDTSGAVASAPYIRRAATATRKWLVASGQMTPERDRRLTEIEQVCLRQEGSRCDDFGIYNDWFELRLLLELHLSETPFHRSSVAFLRGRQTYENRQLTSVQGAAGAELYYASGAEILLDKMSRETLTYNEASLLLGHLAQAATMAYESGNCVKAVPHADRLIAVRQHYRNVGGNISAETLGFAIKGACALWARDPVSARDFALRGIAAENRSTTRTRALAGLDLRNRYWNAPPLRADPREVAVVATLLLWDQAKGTQRAPLLADIVRWSSEERASTLSDAILLAQQAREGTPVVRGAIAALLRANHAADSARRDVNANLPGADARIDAAMAELRQAETNAIQVGVDLPSSAATVGEVAAAWRPGRGFCSSTQVSSGPLCGASRRMAKPSSSHRTIARGGSSAPPPRAGQRPIFSRRTRR